MHQRYADRAEFVAVYVREAHAGDGAWPMEFKMETGVINQPRELGQRVAVAGQCCAALEMSMPLLVDDVDDKVGRAYSGMPDRMYVIDRDGKIVYKGGRGPFGFKPGEMEQSLLMLLVDSLDKRPPVAAGRHRLKSQHEGLTPVTSFRRGDAGPLMPPACRVENHVGCLH